MSSPVMNIVMTLACKTVPFY